MAKGNGNRLRKGERGDVIKYIPRTQAVRKLQIALSQFRRLCILKGIYPVEPKNKRKVNKGSSLLRTFYYRKDIQFLLHEPILQTMRLEKTHEKKLNKALGKQEWKTAKIISMDKPVYSLDHVIRERYPTFVDALRDLDDALSLIFLFSTLPVDGKIDQVHVRECQRLVAEFQHYVIRAGCLRKVFLSIKGIYYQVEISGQTITWITPYQFTQQIPIDVDFKVMQTFLEIYQTLVSFVNYKLYSDLDLVYPPKLDDDLDSQGAGFNAYILESRTAFTPAVKARAQTTPMEIDGNLDDALSKITAKLQDAPEAATEDIDNGEFPSPVVAPTTQQETLTSLPSTHNPLLFSTYYFWLSREVPRYSLEFLIKAFGGNVGWDASCGGGSPFLENDPRITHCLVDRPQESMDGAREYLLPQWVFDSVNAQALVATPGYHPAETLPPHLSPFVKPGADEYVPGEQVVPYNQKPEIAVEQDEARELAKMMMSKRDKKLYDKIQYGKMREVKKADVLRGKRAALVESEE